MPRALPAKFETLFPHQEQAISDALDLFRDGCQIVFLDAPTGSGKTVIGETIRQELEVPALYVCTTKGLQDQFLGDFEYSRVLKGRANYPTQYGTEDVTCADCTGGDACFWCDEAAECPYQIAKGEALAANVAVLNTAYLLAEANGRRTSFGAGARGRPSLIIADECDELEGSLMGNIEFSTVSGRELTAIGVEAPKKGSHRKTLANWLENTYAPAAHETGKRLKRNKQNVRDVRRGTRYMQSANDAVWIAGQIRPIDDADDADAEDAGSTWIRDYWSSDPGRLVLKPVVVDRYGAAKLWRHAQRWLLMSATIISPDEMAESLGINAAGLRWGVVEVPMTFPKENRPIVNVPVADMTRKGMQEPDTLPRVAGAIAALVNRHPAERVLVHTVSYPLAKELKWRLDELISDRAVFTYTSSSERDGVFDEYARTPGAILLAPSMDRGFDFRGDLARVVIIAKVPFPNLGDRQVSARLRLPDRNGDYWYQVQTVRTLVQMTGRGVRGADDFAVSYILDRQFGNNIYRKAKGLFPKWWRDALDQTFNVRELMSEVPERGGPVPAGTVF